MRTRRGLNAELVLSGVLNAACHAMGSGSAAAPTAPLAAGELCQCAERASARRESPPAFNVRLRPMPSEGGGSLRVSLTLSLGESGQSDWRVPGALLEPLTVEVHFTEARGLAGATGETATGGARATSETATGGARATGETATGGAGTPGAGTPGERFSLEAIPGAVLHLSVPARAGGSLAARLDYDVPAHSLRGVDWQLDDNGFFSRGRDWLLLPLPSSGEARDTSVEIDPSAYGTDGRAVSSIGIGSVRRAPMTSQALEEVAFAAGWFGSAVFATSEGHDEAAWFGSPAFDPRPLAAEVASFRTAVRERLRDFGDRPLTLILRVDPGIDDFEVSRLPVSIVARMAPGMPLTARLRLSLLHQVLKEWVGARIALRDEAGKEAVWFTEGLCRYLARELAFQFGLLTPNEYAEEVNGLLAAQAILLQPQYRACAAHLRGGAPGERVPFEGCGNVIELARGALHASELDLALRAANTSLLAVLAALLSKGQGSITPAVWQDNLRVAGGEPARRAADEFLRGRVVAPASQAFGKCFARRKVRYGESLLGFEYELSSAGPPFTVTRVASGGPAFSAGLREGAALLEIDYLPHVSDRPVRLVRADGARLEYKADRRWVPALGIERIAGVRDEDCTR